MPPVFNAPLPLPGPGFVPPAADHINGDDMVFNLRLSERCPVKRVVSHFVSDERREQLYGSFNRGASTIGHMLAAIWIHASFDIDGVENYPEAGIFWKWGVTHDDCFVPNNGQEHWGLHEIKTTSSKRLIPSGDHYDQVKRRLYAMHAQGLTDIPATIVMIGKAGSSGGIVGDKYPVTLEPPDIERLSEEFDFVDQMMRCGLEHGTLRPMGRDVLKSWCKCGQCFPIQKADATADLIELIEEYSMFIDQYNEAVEWYEGMRDKIREIVLPYGRAKYEVGDYDIKVSKSGSLTINRVDRYSPT